MATTRLSIIATPGRNYSFSAKEEAEVIAVGAMLAFLAKEFGFSFSATGTLEIAHTATHTLEIAHTADTIIFSYTI